MLTLEKRKKILYIYEEKFTLSVFVPSCFQQYFNTPTFNLLLYKSSDNVTERGNRKILVAVLWIHNLSPESLYCYNEKN